MMDLYFCKLYVFYFRNYFYSQNCAIDFLEILLDFTNIEG